MKPNVQSYAKKSNKFSGAKYLFAILAALSLLSCSKDDDKPFVLPVVQSNLKATIDGTSYTFNKFVVETESVVEPDHSYVDLHVIASIEGDESKRIEFNLEQNVPGPQTIYYMYYVNGDSEYDTDHADASFTSDVGVNAARRIIGTFSGHFANDTGSVTIANGSFDITY